MTRRRPVVHFLIPLLILACSGPQAGTDDSGPSPDEPSPEEETRVVVAQYETFDVSSYAVEPPKQTVEVSHQVPRQLMTGRADEGARQTVEGYRIQVFSAQDQEAAYDFRQRVRQWWQAVEESAPSDLFRDDMPIVIEYSQPYYRVRLGAFARRETAGKALEFVQDEYSGAFVARSTVTVIQ
jgi:Sporulation related domain.